MATENPFVKLFSIDFKDHVEVKKSGNTELKYVSWAYAWAEVKKLYPSASYEVKKFNGLPYVYDPITGFMVYTSVTIEGVSHEMWLPVLDSSTEYCICAEFCACDWNDWRVHFATTGVLHNHG